MRAMTRQDLIPFVDHRIRCGRTATKCHRTIGLDSYVHPELLGLGDEASKGRLAQAATTPWWENAFAQRQGAQECTSTLTYTVGAEPISLIEDEAIAAKRPTGAPLSGGFVIN